jgi:DNA-binding CsgD family transcriptional regulator
MSEVNSARLNVLVDPGEVLAEAGIVIDTGYLLRLVTVVDSAKRVSSLARTLAKDVASDVGVHKVVIAALAAESRLRPTSVYGHDEVELLTWAEEILAGDDSLALGIRSGMLAVYPESEDASAHARFLFPIRSGNEFVGALLCEAGPARREGDIASVAAPFVIVSKLLGLVTRATWDGIGLKMATGATSRNGGDRRQGAYRDNVDAQDTLTDRQMRILRLMADGLTNAQIAERISFSESTVRLETLAIFRHFDVHSRRDAAEAARLQGMLASPDH